jgi:hypothetical protein
MPQTTIRVVFRIDTVQWCDRDRKEVTAILPDIEEKHGHWTCYAHIGQHGTCAHDWYYKNTRPATPAEYADLLAELTAVYGGKYDGDPDGIKLRVVKRISNKGAR